MKRIMIGCACLLSLAAGPVLAADTPASEASIRELLELTQSRRMIDAALAQVDAITDSSLREATTGQANTPEQEKILADMRAKIKAILRDEMKWEILEPMFVEIYRSSFNQMEVDGMVAFYRSDAGKAVTAKMPAVMQNTMLFVQKRMTAVMPRLEALMQETVAQMRASAREQKTR